MKVKTEINEPDYKMTGASYLNQNVFRKDYYIYKTGSNNQRKKMGNGKNQDTEKMMSYIISTCTR
jgi:hypothetical protein